MDHTVERELTVRSDPRRSGGRSPRANGSARTRRSTRAPPARSRAGDRSGFVEEVEEPRRLVFWWRAPGEDATRVEIELEEDDGEGTGVRVTETRPLAMLDGARPGAVEFGARSGRAHAR